VIVAIVSPVIYRWIFKTNFKNNLKRILKKMKANIVKTGILEIVESIAIRTMFKLIFEHYDVAVGSSQLSLLKNGS
jgi:hypothetical protein